jgi:Bacterial Ig-like domain (group 3)
VGELVLQTASASNLQSFRTSEATASFTLQAILQPGSFVDTKESAPLPIDGSIIFKDNGKTIGTGSLGANGTMASLGLTDVAAGSHLYTATYAGDSNYSEYSFGAVTVIVPRGSAKPTLVSAYLAAKGKADTMVKGDTLQITAYGTHSDGMVVALPNAGEDRVIAWNTSDHEVAKITKHGHATAMRTGTVKIEAKIGTIEASPLKVAVEAAGSH